MQGGDDPAAERRSLRARPLYGGRTMGHQHQRHRRELPERSLSLDAGDVHQSSDPRQGRGESTPIFHSSDVGQMKI